MAESMTTFRIRWRAGGKEKVTEFPAASEVDARRAFNAYKLPGVGIISIEPVDPDAAARLIVNHPSNSPSGPLIARRKLDTEEDAK